MDWNKNIRALDALYCDLNVSHPPTHWPTLTQRCTIEMLLSCSRVPRRAVRYVMLTVDRSWHAASSYADTRVWFMYPMAFKRIAHADASNGREFSLKISRFKKERFCCTKKLSIFFIYFLFCILNYLHTCISF